jgi:hypothetical protein
MSLEVGRRVFVGSVAAGLPFIGGPGAQLAWAQLGNAGATQDPIFNQLLADMKGAVRALSKSNSAEQTRRLASSLRLLSVWGTTNRIDTQVKETLRAAVTREGRDALLRREVDQAMFRAESRQFGFDGTSVVPLPAIPVVDYATKQRFVDDLVANGVTAHWSALADILEVAATSLDRRAALRSGNATLVAQTDPSICRMVQQEMYYLSLQMAFWCAPWFYGIPEPCGLATSAYLGVASVAWWYSC